MPSKQQDVSKSNISPVLFLTLEGEPMSFFLRPGPIKRTLQPLITAGGGMLCNVQQPGAILLIYPEERGSIPETTAHWYVSTEYIHDCIEKDEQLDLEDYRLNPEVVPTQSARLNNNKVTSPGTHSTGRVAYTAEDDDAILSHVSKHNKEVGGNRLWQEMEKQRVTSHSWQSMKYRYRVRLAKRQSEVVEVETTEEDTKATEGEPKVEGNQETDVQKPSSTEDAASPQTHPAETDLTQIEAQLIPSESTQPDIEEAQTAFSPQEEVQHVIDEQPAESTQVETVRAATFSSPRPEGPCLDPKTDAHPIPAENMEPETDESQTSIISLQKESVPEESPLAQPDTSSQKKPTEKENASPKPEQPQRRITRQQLLLEELSTPEPYGKKLRSSTTSPGQLSSSPQPSKKTKTVIKSSLQKDTTSEQPPSKIVTESKQEESGQAAAAEMAHTDTESNSVPQKGEKKTLKRKLCILHLASKEFEDENESDEDEPSDLQNPTKKATIQPSSTEPPISQASECNRQPKTGGIKPAATEAVDATSKAHLFIFDSESQMEDSQSIIENITVAPANPQRVMNKDTALSLTQVQLEEDKQRIKELMNQTNQDLVSVTKALLKTSGDFSAAREQLLNPSSISGPLWNRCDANLLFSADPVVRQQLQEKYSEEGVAKRIMFLEVEG